MGKGKTPDSLTGPALDLALMPELPARVRVSRLPLPLTQPVRGRLGALLPAADFSRLTGGAVAIAGGNIIGAALRWPGGEAAYLESGWRNRGIEQTLQDALQGAASGQQAEPS